MYLHCYIVDQLMLYCWQDNQPITVKQMHWLLPRCTHLIYTWRCVYENQLVLHYSAFFYFLSHIAFILLFSQDADSLDPSEKNSSLTIWLVLWGYQKVTWKEYDVQHWLLWSNHPQVVYPVLVLFYKLRDESRLFSLITDSVWSWACLF